MVFGAIIGASVRRAVATGIQNRENTQANPMQPPGNGNGVTETATGAGVPSTLLGIFSGGIQGVINGIGSAINPLGGSGNQQAPRTREELQTAIEAADEADNEELEEELEARLDALDETDDD